VSLPLAFSALRRNCFPNSTLIFQLIDCIHSQKRNIFISELWSTSYDFELQMWPRRSKGESACLMSFVQKLYVHTRTHTKTGPIALPGPPNYYYYYYSFHFMAIFPGESGSADSPQVLLHLFQNLTCGDQCNRVFYGLAVLSATQESPKHKALTITSGLTLSVLHPQPDSWRKGMCYLYIISPIPVPHTWTTKVAGKKN